MTESTRQRAKRLGETTYLGSFCKKHTEHNLRTTCNGWCTKCARETDQRKREQYPERYKSYRKKTYEKNIERLVEEAKERSTQLNINWEYVENKGKEWTGAEIEIALREDLTIAEIAELLDRSYSAVCNVRRKCKYDPRYIDKITGKEYK